MDMAQQPPRMNIDTSALLMEFTTSVWTARKLDRKVTDETNTNKKAAKDASRVNKNLLAGRAELSRITSFAAETRAYFYGATRPWTDSGLRLLAAKDFVRVNDVMEDKRTVFQSMVASFITVYPSIITAQAMALGDMFNRDEYPNPADIASKFAYSVSYYPVASAGDFRVEIGDEAAKELKEYYERQFEERVSRVMRENWEELHTTISHLVDRLGYEKTSDDERPRIFRDSLVPNALELCGKLKMFNITNDPVLDDARARLEKLLLTTSSDELRKERDTREYVRSQCEEIADKFKV